MAELPTPDSPEPPPSLLASAKSATRQLAQGALRRLGFHRHAWRLGLAEEKWFWDRYLGSGGYRWPEEFRTRMSPGLELPRHLVELLPAPAGARVTVLDVGSGPLTCVGSKCSGREVTVVAVDPLAEWYAALFAKHRVEPAVRPIACDAERLRSRFTDNSFDLVHARNCIDHGVDPPRAIEEMLAVVKTGCHVVLDHAVNEAQKQRYRGLHQWNFFEKGGRFFVGGKRSSVDLSQALASRAEVRCDVGSDGWIRARLRKK